MRAAEEAAAGARRQRGGRRAAGCPPWAPGAPALPGELRCPHRAPSAGRSLSAHGLPRHCRVAAPHSSGQGRLHGACPMSQPPGSGAPRAGHGGSGVARCPLSCPCIFLAGPSVLRARRAFPPGAEGRVWAGRPCLCLVSPRQVPVCRQVVLPGAETLLKGDWSLGEI